MSTTLRLKLDHWVKSNHNVLFVGKHGVGKTAMVKEAFEKHGLKWKYFSASTMDPWVDFVGVPREKTEDKVPEQFNIIKELHRINPEMAVNWVVTNWHLDRTSALTIVHHAVGRTDGVTHLDIVRPYSFATGEVEALFFDEFNRSPKKVRNAVMELIQFGSINGHKFPKLRMVWAAINPDDEEGEYDVEKLDPAQLDRFVVPVYIPYQCDAEWFRTRYGQRLADSAIAWWDELNEEEKNKVSPRRLQYAMDEYINRGDPRDILPISCNVSKLLSMLNTGPITEHLETLLKSGNKAEARKFLENENNYAAAMKYIPKSQTLMDFFLPVLSKEKLASILDTDEKLGTHIVSNLDKEEAFHAVCKQIMDANLNARLGKKIRRALTEDPALAAAFKNGPSKVTSAKRTPASALYSKSKANYETALQKLNAEPADTELQRVETFKGLCNSIPKNLTEEQSAETLRLIDKLVVQTNSMSDPNERTAWAFGSILHNPAFNGKIMGIINHCLIAINTATGNTVEQIFKTRNNGELKGLLSKLESAGLDNQLPNDNFR